MKLTLRESGQTEVEVDEAEYRQALADGDVDQLLDAYASDIDSEIEIIEPDGTVRVTPTKRSAPPTPSSRRSGATKPEGVELTREWFAARYRGRHPDTVCLMKQFACAHLLKPLRSVSFHCAYLAIQMADALWDGPELTAGLRKLLEARNCFVCATTDD